MRGFTLIEVLIAIVVIATGLVLIVEGMARAQVAMGIANNLITASRIAEAKLTAIEFEVLQGNILRTSSESGIERINGRPYNWKHSTQAYLDPSIKDQRKMNEVEVSVKWKEGEFRKSEVVLNTLFFNPEKKE